MLFVFQLCAQNFASKDWTSCDDPWRCYIQLAGHAGGPPGSAGHGWEPGLAFDCDYDTLNKVFPNNGCHPRSMIVLIAFYLPLLCRVSQTRLAPADPQPRGCASRTKSDSHPTVPRAGSATGSPPPWHEHYRGWCL